MRHDLILVFGLWHAYSYGHLVVWNESRHTFLAPAFFMLFPDQKLMRRPNLTTSSIFFTWLRLAYPRFKADLYTALAAVKQKMLDWRTPILQVLQGEGVNLQANPYRMQYLHLSNLQFYLNSPFLVSRIMVVR